jgi:hypothetical protein|tara:strand:+ start:449 stop:844 length:396 start_codon:yes stop_codon:yes gene_type:complete
MLMTDLNSSRKALLQQFGRALNSNDIVAGRTVVTDDFFWAYYEGPDRPDGRIIRGFEAACQVVAERNVRLNKSIVWSESNEYFCVDKVFATSRAVGEFIDTGPFDVRVVDIFSFRSNQLCSKDTYWKIIRD